MNELQNRIDEINFKELELKEFYKVNHPIYLTLSEQKKLVLNQIETLLESSFESILTTSEAFVLEEGISMIFTVSLGSSII